MSNIDIETEELNYDIAMFKKYKNLLKELTLKNIKLKYRNSWLGVFWSFLEPLLNMIVLAVVFGGIFGRDDPHVVCYPVYLFTGRLIYEFFTGSTKQAMTSFRRNAAIIKKVYVPKYMYPLSSIFSSFVTFAISLVCYICVWVFFKVTGLQGGAGLTITWRVCFFFVPMVLALMFSVGVGLILSVLEVYFKDIEYLWNVATRLLLYLSPIIYHLSRFEHRTLVSKIIKINPMYSLIELFRHAILYGAENSSTLLFPSRLLLYAFTVSTVTLLVGIIFFNRKSDDIIFHL